MDPKFFQFAYESGKDYSLAENSLPNNKYAGEGTAHGAEPYFHPSDVINADDTESVGSITGVPYEVIEGDATSLDETFKVADHLHRSIPTKRIRSYVTDARSGHLWGRGVCEAVDICDPATKQPGTKCEGVNGEVGYCFESLIEDHPLMCGRMLSIDDEYNETPLALTLPSGPYRCPRHAPVTALGKYHVDRLLLGGCMKNDDDAYDPVVEVHAEEMCAGTCGSVACAATVVSGCMFPGAENFNPAARAPTNCLYLTSGCTSSNAVNFNAEAHASLDDGTCITKVEGCTLGPTPYDGTYYNDGTPNFQKMNYGSALRAVGNNIIADYPVANNYNPNANVLTTCDVTVEGCMTPGNKNYDQYATLDSQAWCIEDLAGCMMPATDNAYGYTNPSEHDFQGLAINYDAAATTHDKAMCKVEYEGCMNVLALNYNSKATKDMGCWLPKSCCLDDSATNYGCTNRVQYSCKIVPTKPERCTVHEQTLCVFEEFPPPTPPPPPYPPGWDSDKTYSTTITTTTDDSTADPFIETTKNSVATKAETTADMVTVEITEQERRGRQLGAPRGPGKLLVITVKSDSEAAMIAIGLLLAPAFATWDSSEAFLGIQITSMPDVENVISDNVIPAPSPPPPPPILGAGAIAGIVIGALVGLVLIITVAYCLYKRNKGGNDKVKPEY